MRTRIKKKILNKKKFTKKRFGGPKKIPYPPPLKFKKKTKPFSPTKKGFFFKWVFKTFFLPRKEKKKRDKFLERGWVLQ